MWRRSPQSNIELMAEKEVLGCEARSRLEQVDEQNSNQMEKRQHCPMMRRFSSSRESGRTKFSEGTIVLDSQNAYLWITGYVRQLDIYIGPETPNPLFISVLRSSNELPPIENVLKNHSTFFARSQQAIALF